MFVSECDEFNFVLCSVRIECVQNGGWWISYFERLWVVVPVVSVSNGERSIFGGSPASRSKNVESSSQKNFETKGTGARLRRTRVSRYRILTRILDPLQYHNKRIPSKIFYLHKQQEIIGI